MVAMAWPLPFAGYRKSCSSCVMLCPGPCTIQCSARATTILFHSCINYFLRILSFYGHRLRHRRHSSSYLHHIHYRPPKKAMAKDGRKHFHSTRTKRKCLKNKRAQYLFFQLQMQTDTITCTECPITSSELLNLKKYDFTDSLDSPDTMIEVHFNL